MATLRSRLPTEVLKAAEESIRQSAKDNFDREGFTNDGTFEPWADRYGIDKTAKGGLLRGGTNRYSRKFGNVEHLMSYKKGSRSGRMKQLYSERSGSRLRIGSRAEYAEAFQEGGEAQGGIYSDANVVFRNKTMVARPFLDYGANNEQDVEREVEKLIQDTLSV